ncbi:hypothetical protein QBC40DRAFT_331190 [Triangularia verruculosa]|uniref:Ig-like domain-containing protein n=1 Tax=Triangularia verruculosa TaxID=2587418 RepID=A0AAN6XIS9_9PEZI|nr:hypothetical protein QBC40DRAFT_331190 [Triangularia verruculosa]
MRNRFLFLSLPTAVLVAAQGPPAVGGGCTTNSFSIPSWFITDFKDLTDSERKVAFGVFNRATNYTAQASCDVNRKGYNPCTIQPVSAQPTVGKHSIEVKALVEGTVSQVSVNQTWTCNDRAAPVEFTASGWVRTSPAGDSAEPGPGSAISPLLMQGTLHAPVSITPDRIPGPQGHNAKGCQAASQQPSWNITYIYYSDRPADGNVESPSRTFNLLFTNEANGYEGGCVHGSLVGPVAETTLMCAGSEFGSLRGGRYSISTTANFNPSNYNFTVRQTWFCDDENPSKPVQFTASATTILPLNCTTSPLSSGSPINETVCDRNPTLTLEGKVDSVTTLPPYSLTEPIPRDNTCTITSILAPRWQFSAFEIVYTPEKEEWEAINFEIILAAYTGFQYPIPVTVSRAAAREGGWFECVIGADGANAQPLWPYACLVQFNPETKELKLKADWQCKELDGDQPVNFSGLTTTTVESDFACETFRDMEVCVTEDTGYIWTADIGGVVWRSAPQSAS